MILDYSKKGYVHVDMTKYAKQTWELFPEVLKSTVVTPAAEHLFDVRDNATKLTDDIRQIFHTITARSLFMGKRAQPDIQPAVAFLCTWVKEPDDDDWKN